MLTNMRQSLPPEGNVMEALSSNIDGSVHEKKKTERKHRMRLNEAESTLIYPEENGPRENRSIRGRK